ncbi:MAG: hypothetical protein ACOH2F_01315 [Cellulomonas sp.]
MTAVKEQLFADAFTDLVAHASTELFVGARGIGRRPANPVDECRPLIEVLEADGRARRFANLERWIIARECALRRVHHHAPPKVHLVFT